MGREVVAELRSVGIQGASGAGSPSTTPPVAPVRRRDALVDPTYDVRHHGLLADVVEEVVVVLLVELQRFVLGADRVVEELAALAHRRLVVRAVHDQHRQRDEWELLAEPLIGAHQRRNGDRRLHLMRDYEPTASLCFG
jgi:hypothetical protein